MAVQAATATQSSAHETILGARPGSGKCVGVYVFLHEIVLVTTLARHSRLRVADNINYRSAKITDTDPHIRVHALRAAAF